ncbi:MAG: hypothetical protein HQ517_18150 [SAR324 cluster bacterium]|nr:hypothetical protein [SAR324 cluster bacterium]
MTKEELIESATALAKPERKIAESFAAKKESLSALVLRKFKKRPDLERLIGQDNEAMMSDNASNMSRFMESMFQRYEPVIFVETILWVFSTYRSHGFSLSFWPAFLNTWIEVLRSELPPDEAEALVRFYSWMQINIPMFTALTDTGIATDINPT